MGEKNNQCEEKEKDKKKAKIVLLNENMESNKSLKSKFKVHSIVEMGDYIKKQLNEMDELLSSHLEEE